jgi:glucokinase
MGMGQSGPERFAIGVDRGATKIRVGLVRNDGVVLKLLEEHRPLSSMQDLLDTCRHLAPAIAQLLRSPEVSALHLDGIAVAMAGVINREGVIVDSAFPPAPSWQPVPLASALRGELQTRLPVVVENDSKAAAWGEYVYGAGRGTQDMICLTVGTGIGGGLVLHGELLHGHSGFAGLLGFLSVERHGERCPCGLTGCLNDYACGTAIAKAARQALRAGQATSLAGYAEGKIDQVTCELVFRAARQGDDLARRIVWEAIDSIGIALAGLIHAINPDVIVIGGGVAEQGAFFLDRLRKTTLENLMSCYRSTPIKLAELANLAGTIGAAALLW